jgi:hypothetical protein
MTNNTSNTAAELNETQLDQVVGAGGYMPERRATADTSDVVLHDRSATASTSDIVLHERSGK